MAVTQTSLGLGSPISNLNGASLSAPNTQLTTSITPAKVPATPKTPTPSVGTPAKNPTTSQAGSATPITTPSSASTTTISNGNKINQVPAIVATSNSNATNTGVTTNADGSSTYANGTVVQPPTPPATNTNTSPLLPSNNLGTPGISSGGYYGDNYYAPGAVLPTDASGNPVTLTPTSPTDDSIISNLNTAKAQVDADTQTAIDGIQAQYQQLISQQQQSSAMQQSAVNNSLIMGGVTGQGSSAQYAPISSAGIVQSQINYGIQQISALQSQENTAIQKAQQAGQDQDFQLMEQMNTEVSNIRDQKVAAAQKITDQITAQNTALAAQNAQNAQDNAIAQLYKQGITDIPTIQSELSSMGITADISDIGNTVDTLQANDATMKDAAANQKTAQTLGVATQFVNENGKFYDANTGQTFETPEDFFKAAGVSSFEEAYSKGLITDVSNQQLDDIATATAAAAKYPDAGINPTDSLSQVAAKLQGSALYHKDTYIAPTGSETTAQNAAVVNSTIQGLQDFWQKNGYIQGNGTVSATDYRTARNKFVGEMGGYLSDPGSYFDEAMSGVIDQSSKDYKTNYGIGDSTSTGS